MDSGQRLVSCAVLNEGDTKKYEGIEVHTCQLVQSLGFLLLHFLEVAP